MFYCPKCNIDYEEGKKFCRECGSALVEKPSSEPEKPEIKPPSPPPPPPSRTEIPRKEPPPSPQTVPKEPITKPPTPPSPKEKVPLEEQPSPSPPPTKPKGPEKKPPTPPPQPSSAEDVTILQTHPPGEKPRKKIRKKGFPGVFIGVAALLIIIGAAAGYFFLFKKGETVKADKIDTVLTLSAHSDVVNSLAYTPNGKILASASDDGTVKLWETKKGKLIRTLTGHTESVVCIAISPDGKTIASGSGDETARVWNLSTGKLLNTFSGHPGPVWSLIFGPEGENIISGSVKTLDSFSLKSGEKLGSMSPFESIVTSIFYSEKEQLLAASSYGGVIKIWTGTDENPIKTLRGKSSALLKVIIGPDDKMITSDSGIIGITDFNTGKVIKSINISSPVFDVVLSPDSKTVAGAYDDGVVRLWDLKTGKLLKTLEKHTKAVFTLAFSPDGKTIASGSEDGTIKIWDLEKKAAPSKPTKAADTGKIPEEIPEEKEKTEEDVVIDTKFDPYEKAQEYLSAEKERVKRREKQRQDEEQRKLAAQKKTQDAIDRKLAEQRRLAAETNRKLAEQQRLSELNTYLPTFSPLVLEKITSAGFKPYKFLFNDSFGTSKNWASYDVPNGAFQKVMNGRLYIEQRAQNSTHWVHQSIKHRDCIIRFNLRYESGNENSGGSIFFRANSYRDYRYYVTLDTRGDSRYAIGYYDGLQNKWVGISDWKDSPAIRPNVPNKVEILLTGTDLSLFINGIKIGSVSQLRKEAGNIIGFMVPTPNMRYSYDDFCVIELRK